MKATVYHTCFLENPHNRQRLIKAASESVQAAGIDVKQAVSDAGIQIVSTAIRHAAEGRSVIVNDKDADLLVMLVAGAPSCSTVQQINPGHRRVPRKVFRVSAIHDAIGYLKDNLLFLHAVTGSDTVSAPYEQGKKKGCRVLESNNQLKQTVTVFSTPQANPEDIAKAGEECLLPLYGAYTFNSLCSIQEEEC